MEKNGTFLLKNGKERKERSAQPWPRRMFSHPDRGKSLDRSGEETPPEEVEQEVGKVANRITHKMQQQARASHLQPLIESGRCKRNFLRTEKKLCKTATILYCILRKNVSIF